MTKIHPAFHNGSLLAKDVKIGIVISRFNDFITNHLLDGALDALERHGALTSDIEVYRVPGCFEIPQFVARLDKLHRHDVIICLGALIRGSTSHFDLIAAESIKGISQVALSSATPITYGIITTDNIEQAIERAGTKAGNKGSDAALAAIELYNCQKNLQ